MSRRLSRLFGCGTVLASLLILGSCSQSTGSELPQSVCSPPRPQACIQMYDPVCAILRDDSRKTYSNRCMACSDPKVIATTPGACPGQRLQ